LQRCLLWAHSHASQDCHFLKIGYRKRFSSGVGEDFPRKVLAMKGWAKFEEQGKENGDEE
jgi:hypothetical protein